MAETNPSTPVDDGYDGQHNTQNAFVAQARPHHFISRYDGSLVPLIAMDELPPTIHFINISRVLTAADTQGMTSCGVQARSQTYYEIEILDTANKSESESGSGTAKSILSTEYSNVSDEEKFKKNNDHESILTNEEKVQVSPDAFKSEQELIFDARLKSKLSLVPARDLRKPIFQTNDVNNL